MNIFLFIWYNNIINKILFYILYNYYNIHLFFNYYEILFLMDIINLNDNKIINIIEIINYY
jgi:hypothetical protein